MKPAFFGEHWSWSTVSLRLSCRTLPAQAPTPQDHRDARITHRELALCLGSKRTWRGAQCGISIKPMRALVLLGLSCHLWCTSHVADQPADDFHFWGWGPHQFCECLRKQLCFHSFWLLRPWLGHRRLGHKLHEFLAVLRPGPWPNPPFLWAYHHSHPIVHSSVWQFHSWTSAWHPGRCHNTHPIQGPNCTLGSLQQATDAIHESHLLFGSNNLQFEGHESTEVSVFSFPMPSLPLLKSKNTSAALLQQDVLQKFWSPNNSSL